ncbi:GTPase ObgE [Candidatus Bipolaricaulota bacterium]|nr:GTPase ObgE [Candidatus Bipolaricaulota bacterium]
MFVDEATITVKAGDGGHGIISFENQLGQRHGRPDGGNGGKGGNVYLRADRSVNTLLRFDKKNTFRADSGEKGGTQDKTGKSAEDLYIEVPVGTMIFNGETDEKLADLNEQGQEILIASGGSGGRGNRAFSSSKNTAPRIRELGEKGEERYLRLELRMLADVGIVGFPNVGKSSLISKISAQNPKIGNYHFTTMDPHPGVVAVDEWNEFVAVDIPGIIEGAHKGKGLGDQFLKHLTRTRVLIHMVDISGIEGRDPLEDWKVFRNELREYDSSLEETPEIVAGNKIDLVDPEEVDGQKKIFDEEGLELYPISAATGEGIDKLVKETYELLQHQDERVGEEREKAARGDHKVYRFEGESGFRVLQKEDKYVVEGREIEKLAQKLDFSTEDAPDYFHRRLEKQGVISKLKEKGARDGSIIEIGGMEFELVL